MKKLLLSLFLFISLLSFSQAYQWAKKIGSTVNDRGHSIAVDAGGNVYIAGSFNGTADFDPGAGTANLTSAGLYDIFFAKYDGSGNYLWAKRIGSASDDFALSIAVDAGVNVYLTGYFQGTADFDPGAGTANLTPAGFIDIFFGKYDGSGNYIWAKNIGGTSIDVGYSIAVDGGGNVYLTGYFQGTADFDPGAGTANLTSSGNDIFFAKYDGSGNYLWAKNIGAPGNNFGLGIAVDAGGNVYITGRFDATADFDPGAGTANLTSAGNADSFFAKYDGSGNYLWANRIGSTGNDYGYSIAVEAGGNVYLTGSFSLTADFDPGAGTANLTSAGLEDMFFAKYDGSGNYIWANKIGSTGFDEGLSISVDAGGNVYLTGYFMNTTDFDPGAGTANLTSVGSADIFFAKYDGSGNYIWAKGIGSTGDDFGYSIAVDAGGSVYITGYFINAADFDPGAGTAILTAVGAIDIFFAKYDGTTNSVQASLSPQNAVNVYPNPSGGVFTVEGFGEMKEAVIEIYNVIGEKVFQSSIINRQSSIDLRNQPNGIYFINIVTDKESYTQKLIIQK